MENIINSNYNDNSLSNFIVLSISNSKISIFKSIDIYNNYKRTFKRKGEDFREFRLGNYIYIITK